MEVLLMLIPVALGLGLLGLLGFLWALRSGQFDDLDGAAERILFDDDLPRARSPDWESASDLAKPPVGPARNTLQGKDAPGEQRNQDTSPLDP
jgi:cbb3-type cytochrome oxidase maturation protein